MVDPTVTMAERALVPADGLVDVSDMLDDAIAATLVAAGLAA